MNPEDESLVRGYLLGEMPPVRREAFDERLIAEPDLLEQTEALEGELIRDAIRGALRPDEQGRFDRYFLSYPHLRRKYELTREMLIAAGGDAASLRTPSLPPSVPAVRITRAFDIWKLSLIAAAVVVVLLAWQDLTLRSHLQQAASVVSRPPAKAVVSLLLPPSLERRGAPTRSAQPQSTLQVPADTDAVRLELQFEAAEQHGAYTVVVSSVDADRQVWGQGGLTASPAGAVQSVTVEIPGNVLPPGDYTILLQAPEKARDPDVESYSFRVSRPRTK